MSIKCIPSTNLDGILQLYPLNDRKQSPMFIVDNNAVNHCNKKLKHFKIKEEISMLDPEIYAVGTVHKDKSGNDLTVIARDIPAPEYTGGLAMIVINKKHSHLNPQVRDQSTGKMYSKESSYNDLVITKKKIKGWINIYNKNNTWSHGVDKVIHCAPHIYKSLIEANQCAISNRIACIEVEFEEGEEL